MTEPDILLIRTFNLNYILSLVDTLPCFSMVHSFAFFKLVKTIGVMIDGACFFYKF